MSTITLYKNPNPYPYYGAISTYKTVTATPRNQDIQSGYIDMTLTADDVFQFNYLSFQRSGITVYGWVENVEDMGGNTRWRVNYSTDPFRTYRDKLVLGVQYIERASATPTKLPDRLLSSTQEHKDMAVRTYNIGGDNHYKRYAVIQRKTMEGESIDPTPGQPSPYRFFFTEYDIRNWTTNARLVGVLTQLANSSATSSIATMYSIPYADISKMPVYPLSMGMLGGWHTLKDLTSSAGLFTTITPIAFPDDLTKSGHNVSLVFPEAGIMNIPDEYLHREDLAIRQDVDVFSGASNYMLTTDDGATPTYLSLRGSSVNTIPILSNPYETYLSQNQNALTVGLLGDVAILGGGIVSGNPIMAGAGLGGLIKGELETQDQKKSVIASNPPAYLGSALMPSFNQQFFRIITTAPYDNETEVRARYGYPVQKLGALVIPATGFIQTTSCSVSSNGSVPLWAIKEINRLFDGGILFK